ncbi:MAG TPA: GTPase HflX, partial [Nitrospira sp.]|nr:GTPase HflX [Nitrospira sp.]
MIVSPDLAKVLGQLTRELRRPIGVLLSRRGQVQEVIVGTELTLSSTTLALFRAGSRALRGLRFIRTQLHDQPLNQEVLTDLAFLRLDLVGVLTVAADGQLGNLYLANLLPSNATGQLFKVWPSIPFHSLKVVFNEFIQ